MLAMRLYLSDLKLINWVRKKFGIVKPTAAEWGKWQEWEIDVAKKHPVGYFLTETIPDFVEDVANKIPTPIDNLRYYIRNRFFRKCHVLPCGFKPGEYHDLSERILHGLMQSLIDYVEVELAYKSRWSFTEESKTAKWKNGRCPALGLAYLEWEMSMDDQLVNDLPNHTSQAAAAKEVNALYNWWKIERPQRPDPDDASGWAALYDVDQTFFQEGAEDERKHNTLRRLQQIEQQYEQEDHAMILRLIHIRTSLWS